MSKINCWLLPLGALLALALIGCSKPTDEAAPVAIDLAAETERVPVNAASDYTNVTPDGLAALLADKSFPFINVHIPYEGEIADTDAFIPFDEIALNLDQLPVDKDARIVLYCRSGNMSSQAAAELAQLGYTDVWNLDGGMIAWQRSGRPLLDQ